MKMMTTLKICISLACSLSLCAQAETLKEVTQQAVLSNPEVQGKWHVYQSSIRERDAAWSGYLPRLDLTASNGRERRNDPNMQKSYRDSVADLTLTQMLYDGFSTRNEVARLDHASLARLYELLDTTEGTALEAARAYLDVLRYRKLVSLAEDNYVRHRSVLEQIQKKVQAGVGRRVDLEQASGRLALAESNLLIETSNLHDVSARYQRLVGSPPGPELVEPPWLDKNMPGTIKVAVEGLLKHSPALKAAIENVRAAQSAASARKSAYQPRVDLKLKSERGTNLNGYTGDHATDSAAIVVNWNLFNGGGDLARDRQYAEQLNLTRDLRDKACRDTRQTLAIAFNDTLKLKDQLGFLDQHQISTEKARDAYRKQFDIGQRTLLDLLDSENELFQAKRAYASAEYDLATAYVRVHAATGNLLKALEISRANPEQTKEPENWESDEEIASQCPAEGPVLYVANKAALDERAMELLRDLAPKQPIAVTPPPATSAGTPENELSQALKAWVTAWSSRNLQAYLDAYAATFAPADGSDRSAWAGKRKRVVSNAQDIRLDVTDIKLAVRDTTHAVSTFKQTYRSLGYQDVVMKTLEWEKLDGRWLIVRETATSAP